MQTPSFDQYLEYRRDFAVSRELATATLEWAEPLARQALGVHAHRDGLGMGEKLQYIPAMTSAADNGGWGELMPAWFKPYERPLPIFILDNWALTACIWQSWFGNVGPEFNVENLLKIFLGGDLLIPFLPQVQGGGYFLRHGAFTMLLGVLWLEPASRDAFLAYNSRGARRFAEAYDLRHQADLEQFIGQLEFEALFLAEGAKIGGQEKVRDFLADEAMFSAYAALFGGLCFSLVALYDWYGPDWQSWIFQKVNLDYRLGRFGLQAWAKWLGVEYVEPPPDPGLNSLFRDAKGTNAS